MAAAQRRSVDERALGTAMVLEHGFRDNEDRRETVRNDLKLGELAPCTLAQWGSIIIAGDDGWRRIFGFPFFRSLRLCRGCK